MLSIITSQHFELKEFYLLKTTILNREICYTNLKTKNTGKKNIRLLERKIFLDLISNYENYKNCTFVIFEYQNFIHNLTNDQIRKFEKFICLHRSYNINIFISTNSIYSIRPSLSCYCQGFIHLTYEDNKKDYKIHSSPDKHFREPIFVKHTLDEYNKKQHYQYTCDKNVYDNYYYPPTEIEEIQNKINNF